ncbi:MAG TPA: hypothetical protein VIM84_13215, partial [Gemmatimonadales bacterium]
MNHLDPVAFFLILDHRGQQIGKLRHDRAEPVPDRQAGFSNPVQPGAYLCQEAGLLVPKLRAWSHVEHTSLAMKILAGSASVI